MDRLKFTIRALMEMGFTELYPTEKVRPLVQEKPQDDKQKALRELYERMEREGKCVLYEGASGYVFGDGSPYSPVVFVGEAPGEEEDRQKKPFVGRAGQYLNEKLRQVGLRREDVYITNVVKSRPPGNRKPTKEEMLGCLPYLRKEIEIIKPSLIVCLGATAYEGIFGKSAQITKIRGQVFPYPYNPKIKVLVMYHPAYVLRNPNADVEFSQDMKKVAQLLGVL